MSLDKAIAHGKERRKPYRGAEAVDASCRHHGGDPWSEGERTYKARKEAQRARSKELEYFGL